MVKKNKNICTLIQKKKLMKKFINIFTLQNFKQNRKYLKKYIIQAQFFIRYNNLISHKKLNTDKRKIRNLPYNLVIMVNAGQN